MEIMTIILGISVVIAIGYIFYEIITYLISLNKSLKQKLNSEKLIIIPEDFYNFNEELKIEIKEYNQKVLDVLNKFNNKTKDIDNRIDILINQIKEQDEELEKYRKGFEITHIKNSVQNYINAFEQTQLLFNSIKESSNDSKYIDDIEAIYRLLQEALDNNGITKYSPKINTDYLKDEYVDDDPLIVNTENEKLKNKIAEIIRPAYILKSSNKVIRKSKVKIYKLEK